jgi:hypothetical protein
MDKENEPRSGERTWSAFFFRPIRGSTISRLGPTAHAVGYLLTLLRSYFRKFCAVQILICARDRCANGFALDIHSWNRSLRNI